jgi:hypothetical protein
MRGMRSPQRWRGLTTLRPPEWCGATASEGSQFGVQRDPSWMSLSLRAKPALLSRLGSHLLKLSRASRVMT